MRSGLLTFGIILLVLGMIFYFVPAPQPTTGDTMVRTISVIGMIVGAICIILGLILPGAQERVAEQEATIENVQGNASVEQTLNRRERRAIKFGHKLDKKGRR